MRRSFAWGFVLLAVAGLGAVPARGSGGEDPASAVEEVRLASTSEAPGGNPALSLEIDPQAYARLWETGRGRVREFPLPGRRAVDLDLTAFNVVAPGARFVAVGEDGERLLPPPEIRFLRGSVAGDPTSLVSLSLFEGRIAGFIRAWGEEFNVGPVAWSLHRPGSREIRVRNRAVETERRSCDLDTPGHELALPEPDTTDRGGSNSLQGIDAGTQLKAQIAIDATVEWFDHFGDLTAAQTYILNLMAQVSTIYDSEILVQLEVPFLRVFTAEPDPYTDGSTSTSVLLNDLLVEWNATQSGVSRTVAHLFSVRPSGGSGLAYVDVLCDNEVDPGDSFDYGVSTVSAVGSSFEKDLVAHELGHNFSSPHTDCYMPEIDQCRIEAGCYAGPEVQTVGTIMSRCDDDISEFHPRVEDEKIRPAAEAAFPSCIDTAGLPGSVREQSGDGLRVAMPNSCPAATLQIDDGSHETNYAALGSGQLAWVNRLTPACYPFRLTQIDVLIASSSVAVGRSIRALVYSDPAGTGDPANAVLVHNEDVTVQVVSSGTYNQYVLATPVTLTSGDFYVGFYDLVADPDNSFIAARDNDTIGDAYRAFNSTSPDGFSQQTDGTWMIRVVGGPVVAGSVLLDWGLACNDAGVPGQDFGVYRGDIGNFTATTNLTCSTTRATDYLVEGAAPDSFFLVAPQTTAAEGSFGQTSAGVERPPAATTCRPYDPAACP